MTSYLTPSSEPLTMTDRARPAARAVTPAEAGIGAYLLVAMVTGARAALLVSLGVLIVVLAWHGHRHAHRAADPARRHRRGIVELVLGGVLLARDGIPRSLGWLVLGVVVAAFLTVVAFGLLVSAAHGAALFVAVAAALGVALWHRQSAPTTR